jgi:hypothetical protein
MSRFHFYHHETGVLHSNTIVIDAPNAEAVAQLNCPADHKPIEGDFDPLSQRVDVSVTPEIVDAINVHGQVQGKRSVHQVIDYQPPAPSADHEWNAETKRWRLTAAAQAKIQGREAAQARIRELEDSQHLHVREMLLGSLSARPRLQAIADEIAALQSAL